MNIYHCCLLFKGDVIYGHVWISCVMSRPISCTNNWLLSEFLAAQNTHRTYSFRYYCNYREGNSPRVMPVQVSPSLQAAKY